jgi:tetratricopeptide (TPR) repeat protein
MARKSFFNIVINSVVKAADKSIKASRKKREQDNKVRLRAVEKLQKQNATNQKIWDEHHKIIEIASKGYVQVTVKSLEKYIRGAIIEEGLLIKMGRASLEGKAKIFVHKDVLNDMEKRLSEYNAKEKMLFKCVELNNKGIEYEKEGNIALAIKTYEKNIQGDYPAHHSFKRLMVLYRKGNDCKNEHRVIIRALEVFPDWPEYINRLNKVEQLINKNSCL